MYQICVVSSWLIITVIYDILCNWKMCLWSIEQPVIFQYISCYSSNNEQFCLLIVEIQKTTVEYYFGCQLSFLNEKNPSCIFIFEKENTFLCTFFMRAVQIRIKIFDGRKIELLLNANQTQFEQLIYYAPIIPKLIIQKISFSEFTEKLIILVERSCRRNYTILYTSIYQIQQFFILGLVEIKSSPG